MVARAKLAFQRQSCSADQSQSSRVRRLDLPERRPRSWSANVPQSPTAELTQEEVFGQQLYIDAEVEVKFNEERQFVCMQAVLDSWYRKGVFMGIALVE